MPSHKILRISNPDSRLQDILSRELGISSILSQVLINRGVNSAACAKQFLDIKVEDLIDPFAFRDMEKAVALIRRAGKNKDKVLIFGDYDVDGVTALVIMKNALESIGITAEHQVPHRIREGYGLSKNIVSICREKNIKLLITVDCGTSSHEEIKELRRNGVEVIVTDHHEPASGLEPEACAVINPKMKNSGYPFRELAGAGVAFKLCQALTGNPLSEELDIVALGTIADVVPLLQENRVIVREGLLRLNETRRPGLCAMIESAGIKGRTFTTTTVSFILGPRINASGRMDTAETALRLLMTQDADEARELAGIIEAHNRSRQKIEGRIMEEAEELINKEVNFKEHKVIVIAKEDWHEGVLGIVASKLADRFYRPAIVISLDEELCKGSGRSIKNFHLFHALKDCGELLNAFGGHAHAAGLVITKDNISDFRENINRLAHDRLNLEDLIPGLDIDMELGFADLNEEIIAELERLEPFGTGNPEPLFYTRSLRLKGEPLLLKKDTIKFWATDGDITYQVIGFGMAGFRDSLKGCTSFDLIFTPKLDSWQGDNSVILEAQDIFFR